MTDMRATQRLLEVIDERQESIRQAIAPDGAPSDAKVHSDALDVKEAVAELRRRGDTLVRGHDLQAVIEALQREQITLGADDARALTRLGGALGDVL